MRSRDRRTTDARRRARPILLGLHVLGLAAVTLGLMSCAATPESGAPSVDAPPPTQEPIEFTPDGKRYLRNMFIYNCAKEYLPYGDGEGPPLPDRTPAERESREQQLHSCLADVSAEHTKLETVRRMNWNGKTHAMGEGEMQGIVRDGAAYLDDYVEQLIAGERSREGTLPPPRVAESSATPEAPEPR